MRAILAWIFTLTAGFAAFLGLATLALLPMQAAKNRATYAVAERYAQKLVATSQLPHNADVDEAYMSTIDGIRFWRSLPGGCYDTAFEASSDRLVLGFWDNGNEDRFGSSWWHCYAYPSGRTTLHLSVSDHLATAAGAQVLAYFLIATIAGLIALALGLGHNRQFLTLRAKAIWFSAFMTVSGIFDAILDYGDDEFFKNPEYIKWFDFVYRSTISLPMDIVFNSDYLPVPVGNLLVNLGIIIVPATWFIIGWSTGHLISFAKYNFGWTTRKETRGKLPPNADA